MNSLEYYGLNNFYKGTVLKSLDEGKLLIYVQDLILSEPHDNIMQESINTKNIVNSRELQITNNLSSMNGIICKPLYINGELVIPEVGDTVFVIMFDSDPKKLFYINISNDKPKSVNRVSNDNEIVIRIRESAMIHRLSDNEVEIEGRVYMKMEGEEDLCGKLKNSRE